LSTVRENRLRVTAQRRGYRIEKSRRRDPHAPDHGLFAVFDRDTGHTINPGCRVLNTPHGWDLDQVEKFLEVRVR
jgi:hypothetical protein